MAPHGKPDGDGLAARLWAHAEHIAYESLHSPFVTSMAQGTLSRPTFRHYVAQNSYYLQFFSRAYALAMSKCDPRVVSKDSYDQLSELLKGVHEELHLHASYAASWGVNLGNVVPSPATLAYTDFLMEVSNDPNTGLAEILCAMAPCARLYAWLGCTLANAFPGADHAYSHWIENYSSAAYLKIPELKERMLEEAAPGVDEGRIRSLVVDFDDTCTSKDTCGLLFEAAAVAQEKAHGPEAGAKIRELAKTLGENYYTKYSALMSHILPQLPPAASAGNPVAVSYNPEGLAKFLDALSDFDRDMLAPVEESGILAGISAEDLQAASKAAALRPGCRAALQRALAAGLPAHVLSINWSSNFVSAALNLGPGIQIGSVTASNIQDTSSVATLLTSNGVASSNGTTSNGLENGLVAANGSWAIGKIVANQLVLDSNGKTTGIIAKSISNARDKAWAFAQLTGSAATGGMSVFVGDSPTDVCALLQADVGVVIGSSGSLRKVCAAFGITLQPLVTAALDKPAPKGVLYEAQSWSEIEAFLFGPNSYEAHPYKPRMQQLRKSWANLQAATENTNTNASTATAHGHAAEKPAQAVTSVRVPRVLSIAGSDSGGGAGIQADIKAMQACGVFAATAITALTAQNTHGVTAVHVPPTEHLEAQIDAVLNDIGADVVKTGMLPTAETVRLVASKVSQHPNVRLVVDPVMVSTSGHSLADSEVATALISHLLPLATLVTPNIPEASALLGDRPLHTVQDMIQAAKDLHSKVGCHAVLIKGGHLIAAHAAGTQQGSAAAAEKLVTDVLYDGQEVHLFQSPVIKTANMHGTGCTLASSISAHLARGQPLLPAVRNARDYLGECLRHSVLLNIGSGVQRPFNHGWQIADWQHDTASALVHSSSTTTSPSANGTSGSTETNTAIDTSAVTVHDGTAAMNSTPGKAKTSTELAVAAGCCRWPQEKVAAAMALYAVTDSGLNDKHGRSLEQVVADAVAGGATIIQIREKDCDGGVFLARAQQALQVCRAAGVPLVINDRVDVALALGPDVGVHVGQSDLPVHVVRSLLGPGRILGVSAKTEDQARAAVAQGADYLGVGAVYPTSTKDADVIGLDGLAHMCSTSGVPIVAIGGIKAHHIPEVIAAGADGVALVSAMFDAPDVKVATHKLHEAVTAALASRK